MSMAQIIFYEKPGCINNTKQKALLSGAGHQLDVRNLLTNPWTADTLRPFFGTLPITAWFNPSAPRIRSGEVNPAQVDEETALNLMIADPLLIRRPLLQVGEVYAVGFDLQEIERWLGLEENKSVLGDLENCPRHH
jgi:nitrogenase-associated protein